MSGIKVAEYLIKVKADGSLERWKVRQMKHVSKDFFHFLLICLVVIINVFHDFLLKILLDFAELLLARG